MPRDPGALFQGYHFRPRMPCFDFYARCSKTSVQKAALLTLREWWEGADQKSKHSICKFWFWCNFTAEKAQLFSAPIHETSIFFVDMVMADIAIDGCVGSYWVLGLQALLLNWRDGYNLTFFCYLWTVKNKNLVVSAVKSHMMSHIMKPKDKQHSNWSSLKIQAVWSSRCSVRTTQSQVRTQRFSMAEVLAWLPAI